MQNQLVIEHDGDTWRVLGTGIDSGRKRLCHLASTTRFQRNSTTNPIQISDFVPIATLLEAEKADLWRTLEPVPTVLDAHEERDRKAKRATPAPKPPVDPKDCHIENLEHALRLSVRAIKGLLPGAKHITVDVGLVNEALVTSRIVLKDKADA